MRGRVSELDGEPDEDRDGHLGFAVGAVGGLRVRAGGPAGGDAEFTAGGVRAVC